MLSLTEAAAQKLRNGGLKFIKWGWETRLVVSPDQFGTSAPLRVKVPRIMILDVTGPLAKQFPAKGHTVVLLPDLFVQRSSLSLPFWLKIADMIKRGVTPDLRRLFPRGAEPRVYALTLREISAIRKRSGRLFVKPFSVNEAPTELLPEAPPFWAKLSSAGAGCAGPPG